MWSRCSRALDHIEQNHMIKEKEPGKSKFITTNLCDVWAYVHSKILIYPDRVSKDISNNRDVYKKSFKTPVGVHGVSRAKCYTVKGCIPNKKTSHNGLPYPSMKAQRKHFYTFRFRKFVQSFIRAEIIFVKFY